MKREILVIYLCMLSYFLVAQDFPMEGDSGSRETFFSITEDSSFTTYYNKAGQLSYLDFKENSKRQYVRIYFYEQNFYFFETRNRKFFGKKHGLVKYFNYDGQVLKEFNYNRGKLNGESVIYYCAGGSVKYKFYYIEGRLMNFYQYNEEGVIYPQGDFKNGNGIIRKYSSETDYTEYLYENGKLKK